MDAVMAGMDQPATRESGSGLDSDVDLSLRSGKAENGSKEGRRSPITSRLVADARRHVGRPFGCDGYDDVLLRFALKKDRSGSRRTTDLGKALAWPATSCRELKRSDETKRKTLPTSRSRRNISLG